MCKVKKVQLEAISDLIEVLLAQNRIVGSVKSGHVVQEIIFNVDGVSRNPGRLQRVANCLAGTLGTSCRIEKHADHMRVITGIPDWPGGFVKTRPDDGGQESEAAVEEL